jgi:N-acetylmuramoyl-L-alanine amidase
MIILLDEGHGGMKEGVYQTKGKKLYEFTEHEEIVYEGDINRMYGQRIYELLARFCDVVRVAHEYKDTPLADRVAIANAINKVQPCIYLSIHNNAASANLKGKGSKAVGTEVWTSIGQTASDAIAENVINGIKEIMPKRVMRTDKSDGDQDKESRFYVLKETDCPAVLIEIGFFDNWDEVLRLYDPNFREAICRGIANGIYKSIK